MERNESPHVVSYEMEFSAARTVFCSSMAMVIGPPPPGLGVIFPLLLAGLMAGVDAAVVAPSADDLAVYRHFTGP